MTSLVSLWDVLRPYANIYLMAIDDMAAMEQLCRKREADGDGRTPIGARNAEAVRQQLATVAERARMAQLALVADKAARTRRRLLDEATYADVAEWLASVQEAIRDALPALYLLRVDTSVAHFYDFPLADWQGVLGAFPETEYDIQEAGRALAVGLSTACVFHLMRVAEFGLRTLARRLRVRAHKNKPLATADWQQLLQGIDSQLNTLRSQSRGKRGRAEKLTFYAELRAEFAAIRDAWRNHVMHAHERYDEYQARSTYEHVRALMQRVATPPPR